MKLFSAKLFPAALVGAVLLLGSPSAAQDARRAKPEERIIPHALMLAALSGELFDPTFFLRQPPPPEKPAEPEHRSVVVDSTPLPNCTKPAIRQEEVFYHTPSSDQLDVVYFNAEDPRQADRARTASGNVFPYEPILRLDVENPVVDDWQLFSRSARIQCLPTRFHFIEIGYHRYREYREGDAAFDGLSQPPNAGSPTGTPPPAPSPH